MSILAPALTGARLVVSYHDHQAGIEGIWLADAEGRLVMRAKAPWTEFLTHLHINLHLPRTWGMFIVGLTGVALLSSLVSGLLSHPRIFKDAFALRWGGSEAPAGSRPAQPAGRLGPAVPHRRVADGSPARALDAGRRCAGSRRLRGRLGEGICDAARSACRTGPDARRAPRCGRHDPAGAARHTRTQPLCSGQFEHVGKAGQVVHVGMRTPGHIAFSNTYFFDGTGKSLGDGGLETGGIGQQILGAISPLHVGWFGGLTIKVDLRPARTGADRRHAQRRDHLAGAAPRQGTAGAGLGADLASRGLGTAAGARDLRHRRAAIRGAHHSAGLLSRRCSHRSCCPPAWAMPRASRACSVPSPPPPLLQ